MHRSRTRSPLTTVLVGLLVAACGSAAAPSSFQGEQLASPAMTIAASAAVATVAPTPASASSAPSVAVDWKTALTLAPCSVPRSIDPACLDETATGEAPARTVAVAVGGEVRASMMIHNSAATASPPVTLILFTFEPPMLPTFLKPIACNGCRITEGPYGIAELLEWPSVAPGDTTLSITLKVLRRPAGLVGPDYEWLAGLYAKPAAQAIDPASGIDASAAFALATGEITIKP
ncbi:MAG: hypothetical protein QOI92_1873 [Chloroflexota bacterium]|jgi:hypothetical protein|nr:hypothetical protein [Chloroflexota bacterium]